MEMFAVIVLQSVIFNLFLRKALVKFLARQKLLTFVLALGSKVALARYVVFIYAVFGPHIYPYSFAPPMP